ncbi:MAG: KUP/HAK/KT family potassium transporter, partial [Dokdonella sp.]
VLGFQTSSNLASAYGIAVTGTFLCTNVLAAVVFRRTYGWRRGAVMAVFGGFFVLDFIYFAANALKVPQGGWVPLVLGLALVALMTSWKRGRDLLLDRWKQDSLPLSSFLARLPQSRTIRVPGMAIFMTGNSDYVPGALLHNLKHNKVLHERNVILTVETVETPVAEQNERTSVESLGDNFYKLILRFGFVEDPDVPQTLLTIGQCGLPFDLMDTTFFLSRESIVATDRPGMALWRDKVFAFMQRNAIPATAFFQIPGNRLVELGTQVEI